MSGSGDIFVISDLHLGDGGPRDNFEVGNRTQQLRGFLDHVGSERGELFVLGDLFELWQMNFSRMMIHRREVLDHLASTDVTYVPGNHDVDLVHFIGTDFLGHPFFSRMRAPFVRTLGGRRFHFSHGHESDPFNAGDQPGYGRMLSIFGGIFEDMHGAPVLPTGEVVEDMLVRFGESMLAVWRVGLASAQRRLATRAAPETALTPAQNPDRLIEHVEGVRAALERGGDDVTVLGHTHKAGRIGDWYFNSGSWAGRSNQFLRISPDGHVRYFEWRDGRAVEGAVPLVLPEAGSATVAGTRPANPLRAAVSAAKEFVPLRSKPAPSRSKPTPSRSRSTPSRSKSTPSRAMLLAEGALAVAVGIGVLVLSRHLGAEAGYRALIAAFAAYAVLAGAVSIALAGRERPLRRALSWARGGASILLGLVALSRGQAPDAFAILVGAFAFVSGALRVTASLLLEEILESRTLLYVGAGSMVAGLALLFVPIPVVVFKYALVAYLLYYGAGEVIAAIAPRRGAAAERALSRARRPRAASPRPSVPRPSAG